MNRKYVKDYSFDEEEQEQVDEHPVQHENPQVTPANSSNSISTSTSKSTNTSSITSTFNFHSSTEHNSFKLFSDSSGLLSSDCNIEAFFPLAFSKPSNQPKPQLQLQAQSHIKSTSRITKPYSYQTAVFNEAKGNNSIIFMETGRGKTFIAIMLIADLLGINLNPVDSLPQKSNGKKVIFLVCDSALIAQQIKTIQVNTQLRVSSLQGKKGKKSKSDYQEFRELYRLTDVFVAIPDVLYKLLSIGFLKISDVNMLVFDECHHTNSNHTYNILMNEFYFFYLVERKDRRMKLPLIVGLTASPLKTKIEKDIEITAKKAIIQLCENLDAKMIIDPEMRLCYDVNEETHHEEDSIDSNKEYIEIQSHLAHPLFKQLYAVIRKVFLIPFLDIALTTLDAETKTPSLREDYIAFIDQKFLSVAFQDFSTVLSSKSSLYDLRNQSSLLRVFEKIQRNLFMLFESLDLNSIVKFFQLYQAIYTNKKKMQEKQQGEPNPYILSSSHMMLLESFDSSLNDFNSDNEMTQLLSVIDNTTRTLQKIQQIKEYFYEADRLKRLISTIDTILLSNPSSKVIIFVANRIVAHFLQQILNDNFDSFLNAKCSLPNKKFKSISVIGINKRKTEEQSLFDPKNSLKELNAKIQMFNSDEVNILIGTSTVEEGLDVQKCNVVIVFTELNTTKSYIQMKGRARKKHAKFLVFTNSKQSTMMKISQFILLSQCMRKLFTEGISKDFKSTDYLRTKTLNRFCFYVEETEAKVTLRNVVPIVNELLQQMNNSLQKVQVKKKTEEVRGKGIANQNQTAFICTMGIRGGVFGTGKIYKSIYHNDKQSAESECDWLLIKDLHDRGALDNHFKLIKA